MSGAASGALVSLLMNKKARKKMGSGALKLGGAAAVAGAGYYAYKKWQQHQATSAYNQNAGLAPATDVQQQPASPEAPATPPAAAPAPVVNDALAMTMLEAMIAAASSDGHIDDAEMDTLMQAIDNAGLTAEENARLTATLNNPPAVEAIAAKVRSEEEAAEIYGAAVSAIHVDTPAENFFLRRLARALNLNPSLTGYLNAEA